MSPWLFLLPLSGALIGFLITLLGYRIFLRKFTSRSEIFTSEIKKQLTNPAVTSSVMPVIENHMDDFLRSRLSQQFPMISMFVGDKTITSLKKTFIQEIEAMLPGVMIKFSESLGPRLKIPLQAVGKKLIIAGTLIGFIIGVIHLLISLLIP
jgi:hypothetical protein